tara:strand:- start:41816 stop:42130 length:315 start_codon:yes stop_codon:yes gene_type:complete
VVEYLANYDYIAKVLCINKDQPELHCNGKCYLMKQLAKGVAQKSNPQKTESHLKIEIPVLYFAEEFRVEFFQPLASLQQPEETYDNLYTSTYTFELLRPPIFHD